MKQMLLKQFGNVRVMWFQNAAMRKLVLASVPALVLGLWLGGLRTAMLLTGYIQLVFRAVLQGEPVENKPLHRAAAAAAGLTRMLFFTGMMLHSVLPFLFMAAAQAAGLIILAYGALSGRELSLLPILASSGFLMLGLIFGVQLPVVLISLSGMLFLTMVFLLLRGRQNWNQLRMRFHLA